MYLVEKLKHIILKKVEKKLFWKVIKETLHKKIHLYSSTLGNKDFKSL